MENIGRLSSFQLQQLIRGEIADLGVDHELLRIEVRKGPIAVISGEVYTRADKHTIIQTVADIVGEDCVVDRIEVADDLYDDSASAGYAPADGLYDSEDDMGTNDIYRSIEDGIPYIPPDEPYEGAAGSARRWKRKREI